MEINPFDVRRLEGRLAVVTGGVGDIGKAICRRLLSEGASVAVVDIADPASTVADLGALARTGAAAHGFVADLVRKADVVHVFGEIAEELGTPDILVNNVGGGGSPAHPLIDLEEEYWNASLDNNLKSCFLCTQIFARLLAREQHSGTVINMSSLSGKLGTPLLGPYAVSKAGVIRLTEVFARELASYGITVNCICPSVVATSLSDRIFERHPHVFARAFDLDVGEGRSTREALEAKVPLGRLAEPEDIAALAAFLASTEAAYITGQAVNCNGGLIAH